MLTASRQGSIMKTSEGQGVQYVRIWHAGDWQDVQTPAEVAEKLGLQEAYVRQLCDMGKLIATKYNDRWWIFEQEYKGNYVHNLPF